MLNKIRVLLIDDLPNFAMTKIGKIPAYRGLQLKKNQLEKEVPFIKDSRSEKQKLVKTGKLKYSSVGVETENIEFSKFFELNWLRNPEDIQLFRKLCQEVEEEFSAIRLGEDDGFVPEIVLFDYALTGHEDKNFLKESEDMEILERLVPIYNLQKILAQRNGKVEKVNPEPVNLSAFEMEKGLNSDNIGCIGGVLTVSYFRNHPCLGIAITRKNDQHLEGQEAKFVEGLVKEPHQFDFSLRGNAENLKWDILLKTATKNLRKRIIVLVQSGKISPSYEQVIELSKGNVSGKTFSFISTYGERHLSLDGLFIDEPDEIARIKKIKDWAGDLIESLPTKTAEKEKAIDVSDTLWTAFLKKFGNRMELSNLAYWETKRILNADEKKRYTKLKKDFCNANGEIEDKIKRSIQEEFKGIGNKKINYTLRLTVLHLVARASIEMNKCKRNARDKEIYRDLDEYEYFNLLFPVVKLGNDLILPIHKETRTEKDALIDKGRKWAFRKLGVLEADWLNFGAWIDDGEKQLLRSMFFSQDKYYPSWLK